jgi:hypothetical protein
VVCKQYRGETTFAVPDDDDTPRTPMHNFLLQRWRSSTAREELKASGLVGSSVP